jgi:DNA-binding transcriptional MerR regulator
MAATHPDPRPRPIVKSAAAFRTISEVSAELDVPQHVLRFWETKFPQIRPLKRGGGRRYYRPEDVDLLRRIQSLLYREGYTIKGVQRLLREARPVSEPETAAERAEPDPPAHGEAEAVVPQAPRPPLDEARRAELKAVLEELIALRALLARGEGD